ncbi:hypothetical protein P692DRAFT_20840694 [Suillus brevipes Sb2]|nr:hypothetical protein P692DRAFT_20840694 [Suillus brevipes Sb2]
MDEIVSCYAATVKRPQPTGPYQTPVGPFTGTTITKLNVGLTPILRAGLGMTDALLSLFPYVTGRTTFSHLLTTAAVYHLGLYRGKVSLQPVEYEI